MTTTKTTTTELTIFDKLGLKAPKSAQARQMAEHILDKTIEYARENGSCSAGTADFLIDTLQIDGLDATELASRIDNVNGLRLAVSFYVVTDPHRLANVSRIANGEHPIVTVENGLYVVKPGAKVHQSDLDYLARNTRATVASLLGTYSDYFSTGGVTSIEVQSEPLPEKLGSIK